MRTIIAGSRDIDDWPFFCQCLWHYGEERITSVVSGGARGVDTMGVRYANDRKLPLQTYEVPKDEWDLLGKSAGHKRNGIMAQVGQALIAINAGTRGTTDMIEQMRGLEKPVTVYRAHQSKGVWYVSAIETPEHKQMRAF